jgi:hypothetical protein
LGRQIGFSSVLWIAIYQTLRTCHDFKVEKASKSVVKGEKLCYTQRKKSFPEYLVTAKTLFIEGIFECNYLISIKNFVDEVIQDGENQGWQNKIHNQVDAIHVPLKQKKISIIEMMFL